MSDTDHRRRGGATRAHVVLFPFMLQGHVAPFRCLAALVRRCRPDARLTVVATPGIAEAFRAHLVADGVGDGRLAGVHALLFHPAEHGLPAGADTSASIGFQQLITLFLASESLRPAFRRFFDDLRAANPGDDIHVMTDMFLGWAVDVARDAGASSSVVLTCARRLRLGALLLAVGQRPASGDRLPRRGLPAAAVPGRPRAALATYQPPRGGRRQGRVVHVHPEADRRLLPRRRAARQHGGELGAEGAKHAPSMAQRPDLPRRPAAPRAGAIAGREEEEPHPGLARRATTRLCAVHIFRIAVQDHCAADDGARERARAERSQVRLGDPAAGGARRERRVPAGVAAGGVQRACGGRGARAGGAVLGSAGRDPGARRHRRVPDALRLELRAGGARPRPLLGWPLSTEQFYNSKLLADGEETGPVCVEVARGCAAVDAAMVAAAVETVLGDTSTERAAMRRRAAEMKEAIDTARDGDESSATVMRRFLDAVAPPRGAQFVGVPLPSACFRDVTPRTAGRVINSGDFTQ